MLVELIPKTHTATLYMKAGDRITTTTTGTTSATPGATENTGKSVCHYLFTNNLLPITTLYVS